MCAVCSKDGHHYLLCPDYNGVLFPKTRQRMSNTLLPRDTNVENTSCETTNKVASKELISYSFVVEKGADPAMVLVAQIVQSYRLKRTEY